MPAMDIIGKLAGNGFLIGLGIWMLKWLSESETKSWIVSAAAWMLLLYGLQNIVIIFFGNPFQGIL